VVAGEGEVGKISKYKENYFSSLFSLFLVNTFVIRFELINMNFILITEDREIENTKKKSYRNYHRKREREREGERDR